MTEIKTPKSRSNVRTRAQDEFTDPELKARTANRKCRARVSLPSRDGKTLVQFECDQPIYDNQCEYQHSEVGRVRLRNGRIYAYRITWEEIAGTEVWRDEAAPKAMRTKSTDDTRVEAPDCNPRLNPFA